MNAIQQPPFIDVRQLRKWFVARRHLFRRETEYVRAVNDVSFQVRRGEILGLVGESGCGKSTLGRLILDLLKPTAGEVLLEGLPVGACPATGPGGLRKRLQVIFQDPYSSLNPRLSVGSTLREALAIHHVVPAGKRDERVERLLERVGLNAFHARRYPHEFSSGQRQRIGIARALAVEPECVVCDEPVSALDMSIQAQILNLLMDLHEQLGLTYLFISHDLSVVRHISDRIAVMYLGGIVELGPAATVSSEPLHPYTRALISAAPRPDPEHRVALQLLPGDVPSPVAIPRGCAFHPRCPVAMADCSRVAPVLAAVDREHEAACLQYDACWPAGEPAR